MSLPEIILMRNQERLQAKAAEALNKAKLIDEITESVDLLKVEIAEEQRALSELMKKMQEIAAALDEERPSEGSSHLQSALKNAAQRLGENRVRLDSEIGSLLTKAEGNARTAGDGAPHGAAESEVVLKTKGGSQAKRSAAESEATPQKGRKEA